MNTQVDVESIIKGFESQAEDEQDDLEPELSPEIPAGIIICFSCANYYYADDTKKYVIEDQTVSICNYCIGDLE